MCIRDSVLEMAKPESVVNFVIQNYGYSRSLAEEATQLFLWFCKKAGITISKDLETFDLARLKPETDRATGIRSKARRPHREEAIRTPEKDDGFIHLDTNDFSFKVRKDPHSLDFARDQVNAVLDYWLRKLTLKKSEEVDA